MIASAEPLPPRARLQQAAALVVRRHCVVPEVHTTTEWADRFRILPESSTAPGPFRSEVAPYTRRWMDLGADPDTETMVMCWASQTLKSTVLENIIGYRLVRAPSPMIMVRPSQEEGENWSKERFQPMVRVTPQLADRHKPARSTLRYQKFDGSFLWIASSQSEADLSAWSAPIVIVDEADRMKPIPQGSPIEIVSRRMGAADVGTMIIASTPGEADTTMIWPYLEGGTFELYYVPCPHCGTLQPLTWKRRLKSGKEEYCLRRADGPRSRAIYVCLEGCIIEEEAKPGMLAGGEWRATNPEGAYPSSHLNALYSPFAKTGWSQILEKWEKAQGKPADLQVVINTILAELWTETDSRITAEAIKDPDRLEAMDRRTVPSGVGVLTAGVDIQDNRIEVRIWGWGAGLESWLVDREILPGDTARQPESTPGGDPHANVWAALDEYLAQPLRHANGREVWVEAALVDSGHRTTQVYRYCDPRRRHPGRLRFVHATKGQGGPNLPLVGKPTLQTKRRVPLYPIGTDTAKDEFLRSQLYEALAGPGYVHLPLWALEDDELDQLIAEERKRKVTRGVVHYEWRKKNQFAPNEALDCRIEARAALELLGPPVVDHLAMLAERLAEPAEEPAEDETPTRRGPTARQPRPRRNWVTSPLG